jgi:hypothetical protein
MPTSANAISQVYGHGKRGAHVVLVVHHHGRQRKPVKVSAFHSDADDPACLLHHEGHVLRRDLQDQAEQ